MSTDLHSIFSCPTQKILELGWNSHASLLSCFAKEEPFERQLVLAWIESKFDDVFCGLPDDKIDTKRAILVNAIESEFGPLDSVSFPENLRIFSIECRKRTSEWIKKTDPGRFIARSLGHWTQCAGLKVEKKYKELYERHRTLKNMDNPRYEN